jgi:hypothetical protein
MSVARALGVLALFAAGVAAQPPKPAAKPPAAAPEFEVRFVDGGSLRVAGLDEAVPVATRYGKLTVPLAEVRRVEFGFRYPAGVEAKVGALVAKLGADAFKDREEAERELVGLKELALPAARRATKSTDPEVSRRAEAVVRKLAATVPEDRQSARDYDTVETAEFTVRGRVEMARLRVKSRQFGETSLPIEEVRAVRGLGASGGSTDKTVEAAQYARQGWAQWYDTGIDVTADGPLEIAAAGTIDQWPQEPGRYLCGPNGNGTQVGLQGRPGMPGNGMFPSGSLVGKIGATGQPFAVGASYRSQRAGQSGRLYLIIAPSHWGNDNGSGSYRVTIRAGD